MGAAGAVAQALALQRLLDPATGDAGQPLDIEQVRAVMRQTEIDMEELAGAVNATVRGRGTATIGQVLSEHPATQGLASVLGLMLLGVRHGQRTQDSEEVTWVPASAQRGRSPVTGPVGAPADQAGVQAGPAGQADAGRVGAGPAGAGSVDAGSAPHGTTEVPERRARIVSYLFTHEVPEAGGRS